MKKKFLYGLLCVSLSCMLVACGKKTDEGMQNDTMIEDSSSTKETEETGDVQDNASDNEVSTDLTEDTLGGKLYLNFLEQIQDNNDIEAVATAISTEEITGYNCVVMPCEEGYLAGFDEEITGFDKAVSFAPMISTIPMVGYIFEVENPE